MVAIVATLKMANSVRKFLKFMKTRYRKNLEDTLICVCGELKGLKGRYSRGGKDEQLRRKLQYLINKIERIKELQLKEEKDDEH